MKMILRILKGCYLKAYGFILRNKYGLSAKVTVTKKLYISHPTLATINDYTYIGPNAEFNTIGGLNIGRGTIIGPRCKIYTANHNYKNGVSLPYDNIYIKRKVILGENTWVGGDVIITPGTEIGEGSVIGAGAVVSGKIPPLSIVIGNPCQIISKRDTEEYEHLKKEDRIYMKLKMNKEIGGLQ